jgi:Family of unknown function (DUF6353)
MNLIPAAVGLKLGKQALVLQKHSPQILFGAGIVGMATSTVLACRATLKTSDILREAEERALVAKSITDNAEYTPEKLDSDLRTIRNQARIKIVREYIPPAIIFGLSLAALAQSNHILTQRNAALAAAYTALDKGFKQYRERVVEKYGEEQDQHFRYGTQEVEVTNPDTGRKKKVVRVGPQAESIYARFYGPESPYWEKIPDYNIQFLKGRQNYLNDLLKRRGHVFLNEVYDSLGLSPTREGAVVGWRMSSDKTTDNYISFGLFEGQEQKIRDFIHGIENTVLLDFNVDGYILDELESSQ